MANPIRLICPNLKCRSLLSVPETARGKTVKCRQCGMRVKVPEAGRRPSAPAPAAPAQAETEPTV